MTDVLSIALYLPQYHPIPENDAWWGQGFTEWTNVAKAKPLYPGHYQPNVPADLGFYDLRLEESRVAQAELARRYGINGFCYYHYWFGNGKRLIERPFNEVLASGKPDFPFCLAWANQTWAGVWHGLDKRVLIEQTYPGEEDHRRHFESLLPAFEDPRYIRVDGKPLFMIYDPSDLPDGKNTLDLWRNFAVKAGLPGIYFVAQHADTNWPAKEHGYDAFVNVRNFPKRRAWTPWNQPWKKIQGKSLDWMGRPTIINYEKAIDYFVPDSYSSPLAIPCVIPNWDNTPRSGARGFVLEGSTAELFGRQVEKAIRHIQQTPRPGNLLFIKSWNEWAEGNYMEPDLRHGHRYLEAFQKAKEASLRSPLPANGIAAPAGTAQKV